jgi:peptide/nickel transport system substrate-binding protein
MVSLDVFPLAKQKEDEGKIKAIVYGDTATTAVRLEFNLNHKDPVLRQLFQDKRFRIAASHAINREQINELVFFGVSEPWQATSAEYSPYYHERLAHAYIEHDPDTANRLLDEAGLNRRGADGFRLRPNGEKLQITLVAREGGFVPKIAELITDDLRAVGLDVNLRTAPATLLGEEKRTLELDAVALAGNLGSNEGNFFSGLGATHVVPAHHENTFWAPLWQEWYGSRGEKGEEPIPEVKQAIEYYWSSLDTVDEAARREYWRKINDIAAENLWTIGTVKWPGYAKVYNSSLVNWPTEPKPWDRGGDLGRPEIWFFTD